MKKDDDTGVSPAALGALLKGDVGNFLVASTPGGIEAQEAAGQLALVRAGSRLPIRGTVDSDQKRKEWEAVGFTFGQPIEERGQRAIFVACQFPEGWKLEPTDHSMWSKVVDAKGRERAAVFFKAAFYDYNAHTFGLVCRYTVVAEYGRESKITAWLVKDAGRTALHAVHVPEGTQFHVQDEYRKPAEEWLTEHYPDHKNPLAYWD